MGTAKEARGSEFQALLLPIRGKILNVQKASVSDMLKNAECASIIQVIGAGSGRSFDLDSARYGKVIIMTDADVDGAHIRTLLLTLFFRYMRPLVEAGRVYAAMPPLHRIEVINAGAKKNEYIYTYNERDASHRGPVGEGRQEDQAADAALQGPGRDERGPAGRHDDGPASSHAPSVTMRDLEAAERTFELLMGNEVAPRKTSSSSLPPRSTGSASTPEAPGAGVLAVALRGLNCPQGGKPHAVWLQPCLR